MTPYPDDQEFQDKIITAVNGGSITTDDGWSFGIPDGAPFTPEVGQTARFYGPGIGRTVRGLFVNGVKFYYRTQAEQDAEHERWVQATRAKHKKDYAELMEKIKGETPFETIDMTGFGGGYERACQLMLQAGMKYLANKPNFVWNYETFQHVYGIAWSESENAKRLDEVLLEAVGRDCTGAMHQCVIGHLRFIHQNSHAAWLAHFPAERRFTYPSQLPEPSF